MGEVPLDYVSMILYTVSTSQRDNTTILQEN